ncbi:hypothetical protein CfE428DRAFT_1874 [Chthoniobacter flavus Ellin428]|uniref:Putative auto-transporter adhesin head GIN domain-containing protein n=1 Tax=Chthoniobacter flavus Ellin428 TaxID=497964 RepID=B4CYY6_9BACT|nr:DUF2807 domain-containing protein [Chthoniobacter flavus]EDY20677.1 hypothetical protein CfE428DRAFT_1874 [Chthoniobacter flavus Ellin428]TCO89576.1 putative autotransporter adhesin-like protein [Chthoniobacter flavus]
MNFPSLLRYVVIIALLCGCDVRSLHPSLQGDGIGKTDYRQISNFTEVEIDGAYQVQWASGPASLTITGDENLLPNIKSEVMGSTLKIRSESSFQSRHGIKIALHSSALVRVQLHGAVNLTAQRISATNFAVVSEGASTVQVDGNVTNLIVEFNGASRFNAPALNSKSADITLTGASNADIAVKDTLKATISGAATLTYSGLPTTVEKQTSGVSSIHHK